MSPVALDLKGQRFGCLVAEEFVGRKGGQRMWRCRCDCGALVEVSTGCLRSGNTKSCGCGKSAAIAEAKRTHGMAGTALYRRWSSMVWRTTNPNSPKWQHYGGRGITVCERWLCFANFAADMGASFEPDLELERIDNERGYEPENCRWATHAEQQLNKRITRRFEIDGVTLSVPAWAVRLGLDPDNVGLRLRRGWSVEQALEIDPR